jgi:hypothetical protein
MRGDSFESAIIAYDSHRGSKEQREYDMQYKSYFGHETLEIMHKGAAAAQRKSPQVTLSKKL